ncbi:protein of unknown function [Streptomyces sp. yr375]|uniref:DUF397 domain-containing protein n=1 Tax=Streptomyces sp. yr375 TaxID=1761906 RepID=UPI0008D64A56|nr:DUF397 domain-containing protein [Streptomyces sp. yr375]SER03817.1 protein of unknown function [Streptomyces sp. yr375]
MSTPNLETATWHKSSYSGQGGDCVEVAYTADGGRAVRDSKDPAGAVHFFGSDQWTHFVAALKTSELPTP